MPIDVELFTADHVIRGYIDASGERLTDVLNVKHEAALVLSNVQIARLLGLSKTPPMRLTKVRVEKSSIIFALPVEQDLTHKSLFRKASRQEYEIVVLLPSFEMEGTIHLTERLDPRRGLVTRTEDFIPLTDARATYMLNPQISLKSSTLVFNKTLARMLAEKRSMLTGTLPSI